MIRQLRLVCFKNFRDATLHLGPLSLLVGTNASGKSNVRDAFRFLHGIGRGYDLAEILGEKWGDAGVLEWHGIRGGPVEAGFQGSVTFALECDFDVPGSTQGAFYRIEVESGSNGQAPRVLAERLEVEGHGEPMYEASLKTDSPSHADPHGLTVRLRKPGNGKKSTGKRPAGIPLLNTKPALTQLSESDPAKRDAGVLLAAQWVQRAFRSMRFLDLNPEAMRRPSVPGQYILGDRGENLSSVLQMICERPEKRRALLEWVGQLTPMDVQDLDFVPDQTGRVLVTLIESGGRHTSAYSASDGTLRFLAIIAAMLGPDPARFYFFEELDNGLHPARLYLLLQLLEQSVMQRQLLGRSVTGSEIQVVGTTHSPQLLGFLSETARESASLVYRLPGHPDARIRKILDIPEARHVLETRSLARLHESGWLENAVAFLEEDAPEGVAAP